MAIRKNTEQCIFWLDRESVDLLKQACHIEDRSMSSFVRTIIKKYAREVIEHEAG